MDRPIYYYSEKQDFCRKLNQLLGQNPQIAGSLTLHDILKNKNIPPEVKSVPTIVHAGKIYSGVNAFGWINEQINYINEQQKHYQQSMIQQQQMAKPPVNQQVMQQQQQQQQQRQQAMQQASQMQGPQGPQGPVQKPRNPQLATMEQPIIINGKELEENCADGMCGTSLDLYNMTDDKGNPFNGMCDMTGCVKSKPGEFTSINEEFVSPQQNGQQQQQQQQQQYQPVQQQQYNFRQ